MSVLFRTIVFGFASAVAFGASTFAQEANPEGISPSRVQQGFDISPIPKSKLRLGGADPDQVRRVARTAKSTEDLPPAAELYAQLAATLGVGSEAE